MGLVRYFRATRILKRSRRLKNRPKWQDADPGSKEGRAAYAIAAKYQSTFSKAFLDVVRSLITPEISKDFLKAYKTGSITAAVNSIPYATENPDDKIWEKFTDRLATAYGTVIQAAGDEATKDLNKEFDTDMKFSALPPKSEVEIIKSAVTDEMSAHYYKRTNRHIALVQKYCDLLEKTGIDGITERGNTHDRSKYERLELIPYIWLTWRYKCKDDKTECVLPDGMEKRITGATEHHILNNAHHPEFHRDKPKGIVNAAKMTDIDLAEMVADWCGMSEERGNTPRTWADKSINTRWKFTPQQEKKIYEMIDSVWHDIPESSVIKSREDVQQAAAGMTVGINPYSVEWVKLRGLELVTQSITLQQKKVVTDIIQNAMEIGARPTDALASIKANIGLTARDAGAAAKRNALHLEAGLSPERAEELTSKYRNKLLTARAERIARTETITAQAQGRNDSWKVAQDSGNLPAVQRRWMAPPPSPNPNAPCEICLELDGKTAKIGEPYESIYIGYVDRPTAHPS